MTWICRICERTFSDIPADAEKLMGSSRGSALYRWNGELHDLKPVRNQKHKFATHTRWHTKRNISVSGCEFCDAKRQQLAEPAPDPDPVIEFLDNENPTGVIVEPEVEVQPPADQPQEPEPKTALSFAFPKYKEINTK